MIDKLKQQKLEEAREVSRKLIKGHLSPLYFDKWVENLIDEVVEATTKSLLEELDIETKIYIKEMLNKRKREMLEKYVESMGEK